MVWTHLATKHHAAAHPLLFVSWGGEEEEEKKGKVKPHGLR